MKRYLIPSILIVLSMCCLIAYRIISSSVAADGTLVEQFWLLPIGDLFLFVGVIWTIVVFVKGSILKKKGK